MCACVCVRALAHFLTQLRPNLFDLMDCMLPGSSVHGILQARILEWVAICFSRGSSWPRDRTLLSYIAGRFFTIWATRDAHIHVSVPFSSVAQSCPTLQPHESQHARPSRPSPTPRVYSNLCPSSWWCHPAISSSVIPFSSCPQSFPAWGSFPKSHLFTSGGQCIGVSASASVLPMNTQDWYPLGWTGWISLQSNGLSRVFSNTAVQKHQFFGAQLHSPTLTPIHDHWKNHSRD